MCHKKGGEIRSIADVFDLGANKVMTSPGGSEEADVACGVEEGEKPNSSSCLIRLGKILNPDLVNQEA